jgi:hypothetical protein
MRRKTKRKEGNRPKIANGKYGKKRVEGLEAEEDANRGKERGFAENLKNISVKIFPYSGTQKAKGDR